jgi:uracil-DNA glycosylase family 4
MEKVSSALTGTLHTNRYLTPSQPLDPARLCAWEIHQVRICACQRCPRLTAYRGYIGQKSPQINPARPIWNKPVPGFGDPFAHLMVVGLSPSRAGSNRTGRIFTGDASGNFLFSNLQRVGFAKYPYSREFGDGNSLTDVFVTSIGRCAAPKNRPLLAELDACQHFLQEEIRLLDHLQGIITLGHSAFDRLLTVYRKDGVTLPSSSFQHGAVFHLGEGLPWVLCSYHPSPKNTQVDHLNRGVFDAIWLEARRLLDGE